MPIYFLFHYESEWIGKMIHHCAKRFGHVYRLTDDLIVMNNNKEFGKSFKEIYPEELEFKKENPKDNVATFLDLNIIMKEG